jgi:outer membrane immunogenic protein
MFGGSTMKKLAIAIAAIALIGTPAFAADMAVKAPPAAPAPIYNWTGWYLGVNAGASFGNVNTDFNAPVTAAATFLAASGSSTFGFAGSDRTYPSGFMGGGQIGYNWQVSPLWVVGVEADFQGALERDSSTLTNNFSGLLAGSGGGDSFSGPVTGSTVLDYQTKIDWFGTVRARFGYVWGNGNVFSYVTGGLAYGKVDLEGTNTVSGAFGGIPFSGTGAFSHNAVNTGWVLGYGTEGRLATPGWTWKIEGLYMDLGHLDTTASVVSSNFSIIGITGNATGQVAMQSHFTDGILRAGLNYKFY